MQQPSETRDRRRELRLRKTQALLGNTLDLAVNYSIAHTRETIEDAFALVYRSYVEVGLQSEAATPIRFTKYHVLPTTQVFVAIFRPELAKAEIDRGRVNEGKQVVGTLTLVQDSPLGLPVEQVCGEDIASLRASGAQLAEVIALAISPEFRRHNVMMYLYKAMFEFARLNGVTDICCAVTPRHIEFYRDILLFRPLGTLQPYAAGNNLEVQGHVLNIARAFIDSQQTYADHGFDANVHTFFFGPGDTAPLPACRPWDEATLDYFLARKTRLIDTLNQAERAILRREYARLGAHFPY